MVRRCSLSEKERGKIDQLVKLGWSQRQVAAELGRSKSAVQRYVSTGSSCEATKRVGRPKAFGDRTLKRIRRAVRNRVITSTQVQRQLHLPVSRRTVSRYLASLDGIKRRKMMAAPALTANH